MGGILRDNLAEGNCESKIAARQWGVNFCREASRCLAGPSGLVLLKRGGQALPWRASPEPGLSGFFGPQGG